MNRKKIEYELTSEDLIPQPRRFAGLNADTLNGLRAEDIIYRARRYTGGGPPRARMPVSYIVWNDGAKIYGDHCLPNGTDYSGILGTDDATVINNVFSATAAGGIVCIKPGSTYTLSSDVITASPTGQLMVLAYGAVFEPSGDGTLITVDYGGWANSERQFIWRGGIFQGGTWGQFDEVFKVTGGLRPVFEDIHFKRIKGKYSIRFVVGGSDSCSGLTLRNLFIQDSGVWYDGYNGAAISFESAAASWKSFAEGLLENVIFDLGDHMRGIYVKQYAHLDRHKWRNVVINFAEDNDHIRGVEIDSRIDKPDIEIGFETHGTGTSDANGIVLSSNAQFQVELGSGTNSWDCYKFAYYFYDENGDGFTNEIYNPNSIKYKFHNSDTSTGTGAQQTIAHGLASTPTRVYFSNIEDGANPYQSAAADATNIYVTAVNGKDYVWKAEVI